MKKKTQILTLRLNGVLAEVLLQCVRYPSADAQRAVRENLNIGDEAISDASLCLEQAINDGIYWIRF